MRTLFPLTLCLLLCAASSPAATGVRVVFGLGDTSEVKWDGSVTARNARVTSLDGWRFEQQDAIEGNSWRATIHPIRLFGGGRQGQPPFVANGVIVWLDGESDKTELEVTTAEGNFTIRLGDIPFGKTMKALNGRVMYDRTPSPGRVTGSPDEQDYPAAAAGKNGDIWLAYLDFRHNPEHNRIRLPLKEVPSDFSDYKAAPGGDQILLKKLSGGTWGEPVAITNTGGDLYRPAVAVDGKDRVWVFWSANEKNNFDVWARVVENGTPGRTVRITTAPGSDVNPAAAADSRGRVWVAWQGWRNGRAAIFAAVQQGDGFSAPAQVSASTSNEWNPAVAADPSGRVTVAWDSYRNGSYDIYCRTATGPGQWGKETPVAATPKYEAYPSIAYDRSGRLWIAYEEGGERWGKDFGAYETTGYALYQGRAVKVVALTPDGRVMTTTADLGTVLPGIPAQRIDSEARQSEASGWQTPHPENAQNRNPNQPARNQQGPRNSIPRLAVDPGGRVWLAHRSAHPIWWNPIGTVWTEYVVSFDGRQWTGPIFLSHSDNLLDNRPALVAARPGELLVIGSSDGRRQFPQWQGMPARQPARRQAKKAQKAKQPAQQPAQQAAQQAALDVFQNDLWMNTITLPAAPSQPELTAASATPAAEPGRQAEDSMAAKLRAYRVKSSEGLLRIVRGEFHRHSEISGDGGNDGTIIDQWRYMIDAASMDWVGCCDHDNGGGREYSWWITQKLTDIFYSPGRFVPMFSYERSVPYPEGHRNVIFVQRGIRPLPRLPITSPESTGPAPDTQMLYRYLRTFDGIVASHTSGTNMGTDWRDNDPEKEPVVEIYQGDRQNYEMPDAPRSNSENDSIGGWRPKGFVNLALEMGYVFGFQASSDHISTHMSYCNILAKDLTRESILDALKKRHVYGATDDILADVRSGEHLVGDVFTTETAPSLQVKLTGTKPFAKVHVIKDNKYMYSTEPKTAEVSFTWRDNSPSAGKRSYYYVRGEQEDGQIVWASPMWITYTK